MPDLPKLVAKYQKLSGSCGKIKIFNCLDVIFCMGLPFQHGNGEDDSEWSLEPIIGTSQAITKQYLRLTTVSKCPPQVNYVFFLLQVISKHSYTRKVDRNAQRLPQKAFNVYNCEQFST